jgi:hypothetical protein
VPHEEVIKRMPPWKTTKSSGRRARSTS